MSWWSRLLWENTDQRSQREIAERALEAEENYLRIRTMQVRLSAALARHSGDPHAHQPNWSETRPGNGDRQ